MIYFVTAFLSLCLLAAVMAFLMLPQHVRRWRRATIAGAVAAVVPALFFGYSDMLGRPKPAQLDAVRLAARDGTVLASDFEVGKAIYLWLRVSGREDPLSYAVPWDEKFAENLRKAEERAKNGATGGVGLRFDHSWDLGPPLLYELPQEALPPKNGVPEPETWRAPETEI